MKKNKTSYVIKSCLLSNAAKDGVLVDRFFTIVDGQPFFSEKDQSQESFFQNTEKGVVSGRTKLYPTSSKNNSVVEFTIADDGSKKEIFTKYLDEIREVLKVLKQEFGFRFTVGIKLNGEMVRDLDLNNAPMNIGHVLKNPNPQTEVASRVSFKKESQIQGQPQQMQPDISWQQSNQLIPEQNQSMQTTTQPGYGQMNQQPFSGQSPQPPQPPQPQPQKPKVNVAMGMTDRGALIVAPNKYVYPITFPELVYKDLAQDPHNDAYTSKSSYRAEAIDDDGNIETYYFTEKPEQIGLAREWIQYYIDNYGYLQLQQNPQIQMQQQNIQPQNIQSQPNMPQQGLPMAAQKMVDPFPLTALSKNPSFIKEAQNKKHKLDSVNDIEIIKTSSGNLFMSKKADVLDVFEGSLNYDEELNIYWKLEVKS